MAASPTGGTPGPKQDVQNIAYQLTKLSSILQEGAVSKDLATRLNSTATRPEVRDGSDRRALGELVDTMIEVYNKNQPLFNTYLDIKYIVEGRPESKDKPAIPARPAITNDHKGLLQGQRDVLWHEAKVLTVAANKQYNDLKTKVGGFDQLASAEFDARATDLSARIETIRGTIKTDFSQDRINAARDSLRALNEKADSIKVVFGSKSKFAAEVEGEAKGFGDQLEQLDAERAQNEQAAAAKAAAKATAKDPEAKIQAQLETYAKNRAAELLSQFKEMGAPDDVAATMVKNAVTKEIVKLEAELRSAAAVKGTEPQKSSSSDPADDADDVDQVESDHEGQVDQEQATDELHEQTLGLFDALEGNGSGDEQQVEDLGSFLGAGQGSDEEVAKPAADSKKSVSKKPAAATASSFNLDLLSDSTSTKKTLAKTGSSSSSSTGHMKPPADAKKPSASKQQANTVASDEDFGGFDTSLFLSSAPKPTTTGKTASTSSSKTAKTAPKPAAPQEDLKLNLGVAGKAVARLQQNVDAAQFSFTAVTQSLSDGQKAEFEKQFKDVYDQKDAKGRPISFNTAVANARRIKDEAERTAAREAILEAAASVLAEMEDGLDYQETDVAQNDY